MTKGIPLTEQEWKYLTDPDKEPTIGASTQDSKAYIRNIVEYVRSIDSDVEAIRGISVLLYHLGRSQQQTGWYHDPSLYPRMRTSLLILLKERLHHLTGGIIGV